CQNVSRSAGRDVNAFSQAPNRHQCIKITETELSKNRLALLPILLGSERRHTPSILVKDSGNGFHLTARFASCLVFGRAIPTVEEREWLRPPAREEFAKPHKLVAGAPKEPSPLK